MTTVVVDQIVRRRRATNARPAFALVVSAALAWERWRYSPGRRLGV